jgi:transcriptional regulator with XRE-family HTH domain
MTGPGRMVTRRRLRAELRKLRIANDWSIEKVAEDQEWSTSKLIRVESGQVGISRQDLSVLLTYYGVTDKGVHDEMQELARASRQRMWWSQYQKYLRPNYSAFIGAEFDATRIRYFQPSIVPGLLQTTGYAQAIVAATSVNERPADEVEAMVELRHRRRQELLERRDGTEIVAVMDEAALRRQVGGARVMGEQLDELASLAEQAIVTFVVLPFSTGAHLGMLGPFAVLEYDDPLDDNLVYLESSAGDFIVRDNADVVGGYGRALDRMTEQGLSGKAALDFLRQVRKDYG